MVDPDEDDEEGEIESFIDSTNSTLGNLLEGEVLGGFVEDIINGDLFDGDLFG